MEHLDNFEKIAPKADQAMLVWVERVKDGNCSVERLSRAFTSGEITQEQYGLLMARYAKYLESVVTIDNLTKVFNRSSFDSSFKELICELNSTKEGRRFPVQHLMVISLDVSKFKHINDTYGHAVGDMALSIVAGRLRDSVKRGDMVFRTGGDEFVVLLPIADGNPRTCEAIFERIKKNINTELFTQVDSQVVPISVTMGFALAGKGNIKTQAELLKEADQNMYSNKNN